MNPKPSKQSQDKGTLGAAQQSTIAEMSQAIFPKERHQNLVATKLEIKTELDIKWHSVCLGFCDVDDFFLLNILF
ncbi:hypothetical protein MNBD_PLANCTO02-1223 [hydrothermal vent metagenome]|uniref:Uncharacterized protein n=1 Tax=hydrothermal vent metagenome TaxID=652676 RepID=A0A3B1DBS5_9ZZZZ